MTYVHCPECGFQNPEAANYCSKCGALLIHEEPAQHDDDFHPDRHDEEDDLSLADLRIEGPALVVRSGGGRAGETFPLEHDQSRSDAGPSATIFLDDVTVSRTHAVLSRADGASGSTTRAA